MEPIETHSSGRWGEMAQRQYLPFSTILGGGVVLHAMNVFVSTTILPSVVQEIGGLAYYAWSTTLFVLASILSAALASRLLGAVGARGAYVVALLIFSLGTIICAAAWSIGVLNLGRAIQGAGGGLLYALAYAVIRMVFPERLWPIAIGLITLMWGIATLTGPALGGVFAELNMWRGAFYSLLPIVGLVLMLALRVLPGRQTGDENAGPVPVFQLGALVGLVLLISLVSASPTGTFLTLGAGLSVALCWVIVWAERRTKGQLMPSGGLSPLTSLGALYACVACLIVGMQPEAFVPYFLQIIHGQSPLIAGYIGALMAVGWTLGSVVSARFTGPRAEATITIGPLISLAGLLLQALTLPGFWAGGAILALICVGLVLVGFGIGYTWPHVTTAIYRHAPAGEDDLTAGAITTVQLSATAIGAGLAGLVANLAGMEDPGGVAGASSAAYWVSVTFLTAPAAAFVFALVVRPKATVAKADIA